MGSLYYVQIVPWYISCIGTNSHFQNKHCSRTDCNGKMTEKGKLGAGSGGPQVLL